MWGKYKALSCYNYYGWQGWIQDFGKRGRQHMIFVKISEKLPEFEKIWFIGEWGAGGALLGSATGWDVNININMSMHSSRMRTACRHICLLERGGGRSVLWKRSAPWTEWLTHRLWKHYLPATSFPGGNKTKHPQRKSWQDFVLKLPELSSNWNFDFPVLHFI